MVHFVLQGTDPSGWIVRSNIFVLITRDVAVAFVCSFASCCFRARLKSYTSLRPLFSSHSLLRLLKALIFCFVGFNARLGCLAQHACFVPPQMQSLPEKVGEGASTLGRLCFASFSLSLRVCCTRIMRRLIVSRHI